MNTDENLTPEDDEDDTQAVEEAVENFDLTLMGVEPMTTPINVLVKLYTEQHSVVKTFTDRQKKGLQDPNSVDNQVKTQLSERLKAVTAEKEEVRSECESISETLFAEPFTLYTSALMLEQLKALVSDLQDEHDYWLQKEIQSEKTKRGITSTPNETAVQAKVACEALRKLIGIRVEMSKLMGTALPEGLLKTEGQRKGLNLPKSPRLSVEGHSSINSTHLVFRFKPTEGEATECEETTLNDVAHNVISQGSYRITGKTVAGMLKKAGHGIGASDTEWSLEFKTGTLYGKKA